MVREEIIQGGNWPDPGVRAYYGSLFDDVPVVV